MLSKREFLARLLMVLGILGLPIASSNYETLFRSTRRLKELEQQLAKREEKIMELGKKVKDLEKEVEELTQKASSPPPPSPPPPSEKPPEKPPEEPPTEKPPEKPPEGTKEFEFSYTEGPGWNLQDITVNKGDNVRITVRGGRKAGNPSLSIERYAYQWLYKAVIVFEFNADLKGEFKMYLTFCHCSIGKIYKLKVI